MEIELIKFIKKANGRKIFSHEIRDHFNIPEIHETNPNTRALIRRSLKLAIERRIPIGSDAGGYYLIRTQAEMDAFIRLMENKIKGIIKRERQVIEAFKRCEVKEVSLVDMFA